MAARSDYRCTRRTFGLAALGLLATGLSGGGSSPAAASRVRAGGQAAALLAGRERQVRPAGPPAPRVIPREAWDPEGTHPPSRGDASPPERLHLHHTHVPVVTSPDEVPGAMRAICRGHRRRGFDDIGYHYAVDPFGRVWQARGPLPGDVGAQVREGAHAQGFNTGSVGVVLIGDFDVAPPSTVAVEALTALLAWLAGQFDIDPTASVGAESTGGPATRFPEGHQVELPAIAGHRDTGSGTSCPGEHLYRLLPDLRAAVADRLAAA